MHPLVFDISETDHHHFHSQLMSYEYHNYFFVHLALERTKQRKTIKENRMFTVLSLPNLPSCLCGIKDRASVQRALVSSCLTRCFMELELQYVTHEVSVMKKYKLQLATV